MAPQVLEHPGARSTTTSRAKEATVDTQSIRTELLEVLAEQKFPHGCIAGVVYIGHLVEGEDGEEVKLVEAVPCRRCSDSR
jgi:hypothetical protein